jgi:hypothetical protein
LVKIRGKQIKQKVEARDLAEARRKLREFRRDQEKIDPDAGRLTVEALCDKFTAAMSFQAPKTIKRKEDIIKRIRAKWEGVQARTVKKSEILTWLGSFKFAGHVNEPVSLPTTRFREIKK